VLLCQKALTVDAIICGNQTVTTNSLYGPVSLHVTTHDIMCAPFLQCLSCCSTFIKWTELTLAMTMWSWWQHYKYRPGYHHHQHLKYLNYLLKQSSLSIICINDTEISRCKKIRTISQSSVFRQQSTSSAQSPVTATMRLVPCGEAWQFVITSEPISPAFSTWLHDSPPTDTFSYSFPIKY